MDRWEKMGYESEGDCNRDRFYDEVELEPDTGVCGDCDEWFTRCPYKGHESVGWCTRWGEFCKEDDERCDDE